MEDTCIARDPHFASMCGCQYTMFRRCSGPQATYTPTLLGITGLVGLGHFGSSWLLASSHTGHQVVESTDGLVLAGKGLWELGSRAQLACRAALVPQHPP